MLTFITDLNCAATDATIDEVMTKLDTDNNGSIDFTEFALWYTTCKERIVSDAANCFKKFDIGTCHRRRPLNTPHPIDAALLIDTPPLTTPTRHTLSAHPHTPPCLHTLSINDPITHSLVTDHSGSIDVEEVAEVLKSLGHGN